MQLAIFINPAIDFHGGICCAVPLSHDRGRSIVLKYFELQKAGFFLGFRHILNFNDSTRTAGIFKDTCVRLAVFFQHSPWRKACIAVVYRITDYSVKQIGIFGLLQHIAMQVGG